MHAITTSCVLCQEWAASDLAKFNSNELNIGYKNRAEKQRAITIVTTVIDKPLRPLQKGEPGQLLVVSRTLRHILLFGNPLRAFSTKDNCESVIWPRVMNLGMVIMKKIGQSACLLPNDDMIVNGRASETERIWVGDEGLINQSRLKIQSSPSGNLWELECLFQLMH